MKAIAIILVALLSACVQPEPTLCDLAKKYPETRDPIVASMFGLPTGACR